MLTTLSVVIGTLSSPDYALFVSHTNPDGKVREGLLDFLAKILRPFSTGAFRSVHFAPQRSAVGGIHHDKGYCVIDAWWSSLSRGICDTIHIQAQGFAGIWRTVAFATSCPTPVQTRRSRTYISLIPSLLINFRTVPRNVYFHYPDNVYLRVSARMYHLPIINSPLRVTRSDCLIHWANRPRDICGDEKR